MAGKKIGCDKHKVRSVLEVMIRSKAQGYLEQGDMLRYRYWTSAKSTSNIHNPLQKSAIEVGGKKCGRHHFGAK